MIKTASLENSKRLFELAPEWKDTHLNWNRNGFYEPYLIVNGDGYSQNDIFICPAPDLNWLLDKLPDDMHSLTYEVTYRLQMKKIDNMYFFEYSNHAWFRDMKSVFTRKGYDTSDETLAYGIKPVCADTPADAACLLLIKLIEQGIVKDE